MGIKANFTTADVKARFDAVTKVIVKRQIERLKYLGEMCVKHARENGDYGDATGNLRSSVGYIVFVDGIAVHENYEQVKDGSKGAQEGKNLAMSIGRKYSHGVVLVVTAGMEYALSVESKGRDVLASAEIMAQKEMPKMMAQLKRNISKAWD